MSDPHLIKELMATMHSLHRSLHKVDTTGECSPMSMLQMHTLLLLRERGSCSMKELAQAQKIVPATMTALIDRLEKKDMLQRLEDPADRRSLRVTLTTAGDAALQDFYEEKQRRATMLLDILEMEEQEKLVEIMKKIDKHLLTLVDKVA